jgi:hypothetical protein
MNKFMEANKNIETAVVSGYKAIENGVVSGYKKIEDAFVGAFLTPDNTSAKNSDANTSESQAGEPVQSKAAVENGLQTGIDAIEKSIVVGVKAIGDALNTGFEAVKSK